MVNAVQNAEPQPERTDASAVRALVDVIKKEEVAVVVNLHERIPVWIYFIAHLHLLFCPCINKVINLEGLPESCYPEAEPSNKLASSKAKAIKNKVAKPFPLVDLADFLPSAFEVNCYICMCMLFMPLHKLLLQGHSNHGC